jgi:hypothetical protein
VRRRRSGRRLGNGDPGTIQGGQEVSKEQEGEGDSGRKEDERRETELSQENRFYMYEVEDSTLDYLVKEKCFRP